MTDRNIVLFSSGVSEQSGLLSALSRSLTEKGYSCAYWRDLFRNARDAHNIALLPMLIKKIPTFDYAVLICEGHDTTTIRRADSSECVHTMRDNVLFEIGLCVMALGLSRTILVTDSLVRLPDDLVGVGKTTALKRVVYTSSDTQSMHRAQEQVLAYIAQVENASSEIDRYIRQSADELTPVVIGAASSTACGYVSNFVFRTLEQIDKGILDSETGETMFFAPDRIFMHIVVPETFDEKTSPAAAAALEKYRKATVPSARNREAEFRYFIRDDALHIVDFPTSIVTSYDTARMILNMNADDTPDVAAAQRFTMKELRLFEATLRAMLTRDYLIQVVREQYASLSPDEQEHIISCVLRVVPDRIEVIRHDFTDTEVTFG